jgi:EF hand
MKSLHSFLPLLTTFVLAACSTPETDRSLFLEADTNKDNRLSLDEVNKVGLPRLFNRFDLDRNGSVTLTEARQVEPGFDPAAFAERDLNQDGKVTFAEGEKVALAKGGLKKQFAEVDTNRDGMIDKPEAEAHVVKLDAASNNAN